MKLILNEAQNEQLITQIKKDPELLVGKKVKVYYDVNRHMFSDTYSGIVVLKADYVRLENCTFLVGEKGRERVRAEGQKNVHAYVTGTLTDYCKNPCEVIPQPETGIVITYNPKRDEFFHIKDTGEMIKKAEEVEMINRENKIFLIK
jgi:hypothetical protein